MAHMDCDAFYASVEKRDRPELRDQPVIVGGGKRGVVTTCCYLARISGVRSAMPMFKALKLCPQAVVIKPEFSKYRHESRRIMDLMRELTPLVQPLSLDEAWMDLSGTERLHGGSPAVILSRLQARIESEIGLTVSIGLAANKFLAKIASDLDKPRGFSLIGLAEAKSFLAPRPVGVLPGVGPVQVKTLEAAGLRTIGDIAAADLKFLVAKLGSSAPRLAKMARGEDHRSVNPNEVRKSISSETTFEADLSDFEDLKAQLRPLCEKVARQARRSNLVGRVATLKLRTTDFRIITRSQTLAFATQTAASLFRITSQMLGPECGGRPYRLIGAGLSDLAEAGSQDEDLFGENDRRALKNEQTVDALRDRFGAQAIVSARQLRVTKT
jgi:DNA polymerase-4